MSWDNNDVSLNELVGKTLKEVVNSGDEVTFTTIEGQQYKMYHSQNCCESVSVEDVIGDLQDLIGSPIITAEEVVSKENPEGVAVDHYQDSFTWTFYKLATIKGYVTIRWYGSSNGYYSESVDFRKV